MDKKPFEISKLIKSLFHLTPKTKPIVGIDIDPASLLLLQISGTAKRPKLQHLGMEALKPDTITAEGIRDPGALTDALRQLKKHAHIRTPDAIISAPSSLVITKQVSVSRSLSKNKREPQAWVEAEKAFPGLVDNIYLDFVMLDTPEGSDPALSEPQMLLIAARKKELQTRIEAIRQASFNTKIIDVDYYALERAYPLVAPQLPESHTEEFTALLNFDTSTMTLTVMQKGDMAYCHQQSYNGSVLSPLAQQYLGLEKSNTETQSSSLSPELEGQLTTQVQRLLQFFYSESGGSRLSHLVLSGRCAVIPEISVLIKNITNIEPILANPFIKIPHNKSINSDQLERQAPACLLGCGLALRGVN